MLSDGLLDGCTKKILQDNLNFDLIIKKLEIGYTGF